MLTPCLFAMIPHASWYLLSYLRIIRMISIQFLKLIGILALMFYPDVCVSAAPFPAGVKMAPTNCVGASSTVSFCQHLRVTSGSRGRESSLPPHNQRLGGYYLKYI